jgi:hypothetical protein
MIEARWSNIDNAVDLTRNNHIISSDGGFLEDPTPSSKSGYSQASAYVENNTVDGTILLAEANKSHAGTRLLNNISSEFKTVGHQNHVSQGKPYIPDGVIVEDNLFLNELENNFSEEDAGFPDGESLPRELFPLNDSGKVSLPYSHVRNC